MSGKPFTGDRICGYDGPLRYQSTSLGPDALHIRYPENAFSSAAYRPLSISNPLNRYTMNGKIDYD